MKNFTIIAVLIGLMTFNVLSSEEKYDLEKFKSSVPELMNSTNVGTKFYFSFPPVYIETGAQNSCRLYISSGVATQVRVKNGKGYFESKITKPNDIIEFIMTPDDASVHVKLLNEFAEPEKVTSGGAIIVEADDPIIVYGVARFQYTSDGFLGIPVSALGKEYIVASFWDWGNQTSWIFPSYTAISSPFDQTRVRFTLGGPVHNKTAGGMSLGESRTFDMNNGDVLLIGSKGNFSDLSGSKIRANKPVSVVSGNYCARLPENTAACDYIVNMELPTETWGKAYHVTPIHDRLKNSYLRINASEDNTTIYRDGKYFGKILQGGGGETGVAYIHARAAEGDARPLLFTADKPFHITQFNPSQMDDNIPSDPFQMGLIPIEQYQKEFVFCTPGIMGGFGFSRNFINIVYAATEDGGIPDDLEFARVINGKFSWIRLADIDANVGTEFDTIYNEKRYFSKTYLLPGDGVYRLRANDPIAAYSYGLSSYESYGFPTSVALGDLETPDTLAPLVEVEPSCDGDYVGQIVTDIPDDPNFRSNMGRITFHTSESYNYKFSYEEFIPGDERVAFWEAVVVNKNENARAVITFLDRRGNDTTIVLEYTSPKMRLSPNLHDYGLLSTGETAETFFWICNDTEGYDMEITDVYLLSKYGRDAYEENYPDNRYPDWADDEQYFDIVLEDEEGNAYNTPFTIPAKDSIVFKVIFTATEFGAFMDSLGFEGRPVGFDPDVCFRLFDAQVNSAFAIPIISVSDVSFDQVVIGSNVMRSVEIKNSGNLDLSIYGYDDLSLDVFKHFFDSEFGGVSQENPLEIAPGQSMYFPLTFNAKEIKTYRDSIVFHSNASSIDSICYINAEGIVSVDELPSLASAGIELYPNPASDKLRLIDREGLIDKVEIYYANGNRIMIVRDSFNFIPIGDLSQGTYHLIVRLKDRTVLSDRFIIVR